MHSASFTSAFNLSRLWKRPAPPDADTVHAISVSAHFVGGSNRWVADNKARLIQSSRAPGMFKNMVIGASSLIMSLPKEDGDKFRRNILWLTGTGVSNAWISLKAIQSDPSVPRMFKAIPGESVMTDDHGYFDIDGLLASIIAPPQRRNIALDITVKLPKAPSPVSLSLRVHFHQANGWLIVSDVDDTLKRINVIHRKELTRKLMVKDYEPIDNMAVFLKYLVFGSYKSPNNPPRDLIYLSASPVGFYKGYQEFLDRHKFPLGRIQMAPLDANRVSFVRDAVAFKTYKKKQLMAIIKAAPNHKLLLIGDSGQSDPEIYAEVYVMARKLGFQPSICIWIRKVDHPQGANDKIKAQVDAVNKQKRFDKTFKNVPRSDWRVFSDPVELVAINLDLGC